MAATGQHELEHLKASLRERELERAALLQQARAASALVKEMLQREREPDRARVRDTPRPLTISRERARAEPHQGRAERNIADAEQISTCGGQVGHGEISQDEIWPLKSGGVWWPLVEV